MRTHFTLATMACLLAAFTANDDLFARNGGMGGGMGMGNGSGSMSRYGSQSTGETANGARRGNSGSQSADADKDGTPNGRDSDYVRPQDGTGKGATDYQGAGTETRLLDGTGPHGRNSTTTP